MDIFSNSGVSSNAWQGVSRVQILRAFIIFGLQLLCTLSVNGEIWGYSNERRYFTRFVWEYELESFEQAQYSAAVSKMLRDFEVTTGKVLEPGRKRRVGIKIYTNSGSGIATPIPLVRALINELIGRGFRSNELFILDVNESRLRYSGFIPLLSLRESRKFDGVPVSVLDSREFFDPIWYYDSALPSRRDVPFGLSGRGSYSSFYRIDDRKSFLPKPLLTDVDFWINLPVAMDHPTLGVSGAIANATLWNISNRDRFFVSPANAPIAAAEIAAIPELVASLAVTIISLERYQFIGGPVFNSLYTRSEGLLWMSVNPVVLDTLMLKRINDRRKESGFRSLGKNLPMLHFAEILGLGIGDPNRVQWVRLN